MEKQNNERRSTITVEVFHDDANKKVKNIMSIDNHVIFESEMTHFFGYKTDQTLINHFRHALIEIDEFEKFDPERYDKSGYRNNDDKIPNK